MDESREVEQRFEHPIVSTYMSRIYMSVLTDKFLQQLFSVVYLTGLEPYTYLRLGTTTFSATVAPTLLLNKSTRLYHNSSSPHVGFS